MRTETKVMNEKVSSMIFDRLEEKLSEKRLDDSLKKSQIGEYMMSLPYEKIAYKVNCYVSENKEAIVTSCIFDADRLQQSVDEMNSMNRRDLCNVLRRRVKPDEIMLYIDTRDYDYSLANDPWYEGIIFTRDRIFTWTEGGRSIDEIRYEGILDIDYDPEYVIINDEYGKHKIRPGYANEDNGYTRSMYGFIKDINDFAINESAQERR